MKLTSLLRSSSFGRLVLPAILCLAWPARAANATPTTNPPTNQPTNEIVIPKSVFVNDPRGKDPFFPNRNRSGVSTTPLTNIVTSAGPSLSDLQLRGITGVAEGRIALINNRTFEKGEEAEVRVSNGKVKIRVLEIREKSVVISIEGQAEPKELILIDRLLPTTPTGPE